MTHAWSCRRILRLSVVLLAVLFGAAGSVLLGLCGPFTDVSDAAFCPFVLEIFSLGITTGTTPTTYDPAAPVNRLQMAAFLSRTVDATLRRGSRRAALNQFWPAETNAFLSVTTVGSAPQFLASDGTDVWVANFLDSTVSRVRASDGKLLQTWTGATSAVGVLPALGKIYVFGDTVPGRLYQIEPTLPAGAVFTIASNLGGSPSGIAYDGSRIWTVNSGSVSIVTPSESVPWTVTTVTTDFGVMNGVLYDGANIWTTREGPGKLLKLNTAAAVLQTVAVGLAPQIPTFDGANIWVPNRLSDSVSVVRASNGAVLATLTGNGLDEPFTAAFDGQRILVTNSAAGAESVSLWKAADLTPIGSFGTGAGLRTNGVCSDGIIFWISLIGGNKILRF